RLVDVLTDRSFMHRRDRFIFGAIYEHVAPPPRHPYAPRYIVAFLFNPPQASLAPDLRLVSGWSLVPTGSTWRRSSTSCRGTWVPSLYVHDEDIVCQGFIEQRRQLEKSFHGLAGSAVKLSYRDMLYSFVRSKEKDRSCRTSFPPRRCGRTQACIDKDVNWLHHRPFHAHELQQWWKTDADLDLNPSSYSYHATSYDKRVLGSKRLKLVLIKTSLFKRLKFQASLTKKRLKLVSRLKSFSQGYPY
ncbi:hypothetical protein ZWY2020_027717, partial [Hordeum vulgare]